MYLTQHVPERGSQSSPVVMTGIYLSYYASYLWKTQNYNKLKNMQS